MSEKPNPLDEYEEEKEKTANKRHQEDLQLWQQWKQNEQPQVLGKLLDRFTPERNRAIAVFGGSRELDRAALETNAVNLTIQALQNYDPSKRALRSHVHGTLNRLERFTNYNQNMGHVSEGSTRQISAVEQARDELREMFGREPSPQEVANKSRVPLKVVNRLVNTLRRDITDEGFETSPGGYVPQRSDEVLAGMGSALKGREREVFEYQYGLGDKPKLTKTKDIAQALGVSQSSVSRHRTQIDNKFQSFLKRRNQ